MSERADFKKPSKPEPRPFQVSLDFKSGLNLALAMAVVQVGLAAVQMALTALFSFALSR